jgi:hypothetical protein
LDFFGKSGRKDNAFYLITKIIANFFSCLTKFSVILPHNLS